MQCQQFEQRINDLLDERQSPNLDPAVRLHARHCPRCADLLAAYEVLIVGLADLPAPELDVDLAPPVLDALNWKSNYRVVSHSCSLSATETAPRRNASGWFRSAWLRPMLTSLAVALVILSIARSRPPGVNRNQSVDRHVANAAKADDHSTVAGHSSVLPLKQLTHSSHSPLVAVATPVANNQIGTNAAAGSAAAGSEHLAGTVLASDGLFNPYSRFAEEAEQLAQRQMAVAGEVADGLRPVTDSMNAALKALRRTIPCSEGDARSG